MVDRSPRPSRVADFPKCIIPLDQRWEHLRLLLHHGTEFFESTYSILIPSSSSATPTDNHVDEIFLKNRHVSTSSVLSWLRSIALAFAGGDDPSSDSINVFRRQQHFFRTNERSFRESETNFFLCRSWTSSLWNSWINGGTIYWRSGRVEREEVNDDDE